MEDIAQFAVIGFIAQVIDGAIGMAFGLTASSILLSIGVTPIAASASVHAAEVVTTAASSVSHWKLGNIDRGILKRILVPGMIGGGLGAYVLTEIPSDLVRPMVSAYLLIMGLVILLRTIWPRATTIQPNARLMPLAFFGAVLDAIGGGGWGPIVTSSMVGWGIPARIAVGSSNAAEFFVTVVIGGTLLPHVPAETIDIISGLIIGGSLAAPMAALITKRLPVRVLMGLVGLAITLISLKDLNRVWAAW